MAENENGQERTEQPTAKRLEDAKRKGQVARSKELNTMAVTLAGAIFLAASGGYLGEALTDLMGRGFSLTRADIFEPTTMSKHLVGAMRETLISLLPFFLVTVVAAVLASVVLGGFSFSAEALAPKLSKLNPVKGMKRVFSLKGLLELLKALAKFLLIGGVTTLLMWQFLDDFLGLSELALTQAVVRAGQLVGLSAVVLASTLILIALVDVPFQLWDHKRQLKMTRQEIKDELKETDGRPELKSRIRSLQHELAQRRMMEDVPKADVIVTNPTHFAVALRYDQTQMSAPRVVAKGTELVATNIRRVGSEAKVPVVESPLLARALYFNTEIGEYIPAGLYLAVAKLLAYVFRLAWYGRTAGRADDVGDGGPSVAARGPGSVFHLQHCPFAGGTAGGDLHPAPPGLRGLSQPAAGGDPAASGP
jgi:flagellar biosynthetic protein FlhB